MKRVTGIGGIFFKAQDPKALAAWYKRHLDVPVEEWGGAIFHWKSDTNPDGTGCTTWSPFDPDTRYLDPSTAPFMINYRVQDLHALVQILREEGVPIIGDLQESEYGKFAWVLDPEGNKVELWQPPAGR